MAIDKDYKIGASTRTCHACGRPFGIGDAYFSAVVEVEGDEMFARRDFCPACWSPDADAYFSFWKTRVPEPPPEKTTGPRLVDLGRLVQLFEHLADAEQPDAQRFRYVLALVLMRKRRLRIVSQRRGGGKGEELTLREVGSQRQHVVRCPSLSEEEIRCVTDRLGDILDMPEKWDRLDAEPAEANEPASPDSTEDVPRDEAGDAAEAAPDDSLDEAVEASPDEEG